MQVANILSDLTSLLICENHEAAHRLVSSRPTDTGAKLNPSARAGSPGRRSSAKPGVGAAAAETAGKEAASSDDPDLARAYTLMKLHRGVKEVYASGDGSSAGLSGLSELREARESVQRAVERLGLDARVGGQSSTARAERNPSDNQVDQTKDSADADDEDISAWA